MNRFLAAFPVVALILASCASTPRTHLCHRVHATPDLQIRLAFGLDSPDGGTIDASAWEDFAKRTITARFPSGFTVFEAHGQWQDPSTGDVSSEPARIVWIATPDRPRLGMDLQTIRDTYRARFHQKSVGLMIESGCEAF